MIPTPRITLRLMGSRTPIGSQLGRRLIVELNSQEGRTVGDETVVHPEHYGGGDNPYEVIKIIHAHNLNFNRGNACKYLLRAGKKDPAKTVEDLKKAIFYLNYEVELLEGTRLV